MDEEPFVTIPKNTPLDDVRWDLVKMLAHRLRKERVAAARRVMRSDSEHVTTMHLDCARGMIEGTWDPIGQKWAR